MRHSESLSAENSLAWDALLLRAVCQPAAVVLSTTTAFLHSQAAPPATTHSPVATIKHVQFSDACHQIWKPHIKLVLNKLDPIVYRSLLPNWEKLF